jgi:tryptophan-rich sensory protein
MKNANWKVYTFWIGLAEAAGLLSGLLSRGGMENFSQTVAQPPLSPPGWLFPVVWSVLYTLMGISAWMVWKRPGSSRGALGAYGLQLVLNVLWTPVFFRLERYWLAFFILVLLWLAIGNMILQFRKVSPKAALLQIPYLLWVTFAGYLNFMIAWLN